MCRKPKNVQLKTAFTLTEVVVASALLIAAIVPILKALTAAHFIAVSIERKTRSLNFAQAKLDEITARSIYNYSDSFKSKNLSLGGSYLCEISDTSVSSNLRTIQVEVGYDQDGDGKLKKDEILISLQTLVARRF